jgi:hypothetical protein
VRHNDLRAKGICKGNRSGQGDLCPPRAVERHHQPPNRHCTPADISQPLIGYDQHRTRSSLDDAPRRIADDALRARAFARRADQAEIHRISGERRPEALVKGADRHLDPGDFIFVHPRALQQTLNPVSRLVPAHFPHDRVMWCGVTGPGVEHAQGPQRGVQ